MAYSPKAVPSPRQQMIPDLDLKKVPYLPTVNFSKFKSKTNNSQLSSRFVRSNAIQALFK